MYTVIHGTEHCLYIPSNYIKTLNILPLCSEGVVACILGGIPGARLRLLCGANIMPPGGGACMLGALLAGGGCWKKKNSVKRLNFNACKLKTSALKEHFKTEFISEKSKTKIFQREVLLSLYGGVNEMRAWIV